MGEPPKKGRSPDVLGVHESFQRLDQALNACPPGAFEGVGGDVAFFVCGSKPPQWQITALAGQVVVRPGNPAFPVFRVGITARALSYLVQGRLDVARAFREKQLAVEGDLAALGRFVRCFGEAEGAAGGAT